MENQKSNVTIVAQCYRYIWKTTDGRLCVRYITDIQEGHAKFQKALREDKNVVSALREYQHEVNYAYIGFTEPVKELSDEEKRKEKEMAIQAEKALKEKEKSQKHALKIADKVLKNSKKEGKLNEEICDRWVK